MGCLVFQGFNNRSSLLLTYQLFELGIHLILNVDSQFVVFFTIISTWGQNLWPLSVYQFPKVDENCKADWSLSLSFKFKYSIKDIFFHLLKTNGEKFLSNIEDSEAEVWFLCYRGLALTLQLMPNLWRATCPRTRSPSSTGCGSLWSQLRLSTPSWSWLLSTLWYSWWR